MNVGIPGFTESYALSTSITIDQHGVPYVVYVDGYGPLAGAISVKKFIAGNWIFVGQRRFSAGSPDVVSIAEQPSIAIANNGTPYVLYHPANNNYKATIKKFIAGNWTDVGDIVDFPAYNGIGAQLAINKHNILYIAYYDATIGDVKVKKFTMGSWVDVGTPGFSSQGMQRVYLAIDNNGYPYVAYSNGVRKYTGTNWVDVGIASSPIATDNNSNLYASGGTRKLSGDGWADLGTAFGISEGPVYYISVAVDGNGTPYTVYQDQGNSGKATARKFYQGNWEYVGSDAGFSEDTAWYTSIALRNNGTPFVIYQDKAAGKKATVKRFNAGDWRNVGSTGFSDGVASYTSIDIDNQGTPYVVYRDEGNGGRATVKKYKNGSWRDVGLPGFSAGTASQTSISFGNGSVPYVAYSDGANGGKATVKKFIGGSWEDVGLPGFSTNGASAISLAINRWGTPYVAYREFSNVVVKYFFGGEWADVGSPIPGGYIVCGICQDIDLAIDNNDNPYIAYKVQFSDMPGNPLHTTMKYSVRKFNGVDWVELWLPRLGNNMIPYPTISIAITASDIPVVVYNRRDQAFAKSLGEWSNNSETVANSKGYEKAVGINSTDAGQSFSLNVYPNPIEHSSRIHLVLPKSSNLNLRIIDMQGKLIWAKQYSLPEGNSSLELPAEKLTAGGIYVLEAVIAGGEKKTIRIVK